MTIQRGEIYFINLNPVEGREQAGRRPVLVLSKDCGRCLASSAHQNLYLVLTAIAQQRGLVAGQDLAV